MIEGLVWFGFGLAVGNWVASILKFTSGEEQKISELDFATGTLALICVLVGLFA